MTMEKTGPLFVQRQGVPLMTEPLLWDRRLGVSANVNTIEAYMESYWGLLPPGCHFDEAAIMVPGAYGAEVLGRELVMGGWQHFNHAEDLVHASPFGTRYQVSYDFYRHEAKPWRLEVMHQPLLRASGFSPLHQALWQPHGQTPTWEDWSELPIPHLSFKPMPTGRGLRKDVRMAFQHLITNHCIYAQGCQSTYGEFFYFLPHDARRQLYVKPRINLRDEVAQ